MNIVQVTRTFAVAVVLVLTATGLWAAGAEEEPAAAMEKETVFDPATGMTWTAPQYGGTITWPARTFPPSTDNWWNLGWAQFFIAGVVEGLSFADWGLSRDIWHGERYTVVLPEMITGQLAESWSMPDNTTWIWNIRQGVHWDDKAPVNGREFDAYDVEWNYHRYFGMGDFTEDGPNAAVGGITQGLEIESVTATDKWTVEIKLTKPQIDVPWKMLNNYFVVHAPEQIEQYGDAKDWRNLVGTGPFRLTDVVEGSSSTWEKNPNYWGVDEKFGNRLPYIDEYRQLLMPEISTRLAALRTGKVDFMGNEGDGYITSIDDLEALKQTNPEIAVWPSLGAAAGVFWFNQALPITADVNVRKAMQMAVDRETIAATYFKGWGDPAPSGVIGQFSPEYAWPYEDWPDEVKHEYEYHPEEAEALLDAAGYPRGADGYRFKIKLGQFNRWEATYPEVVAGYLDAIGIETEFTILTQAENGAAMAADTHEWHLLAGYYGWTGGSAFMGYQLAALSQTYNNTNANATDPRTDALYLAARDTTDLEEFKSISRQADEITVREHWGLVKSRVPTFYVSQPWVQGYFGEAGMGWGRRYTFMARLWIDQELKEATGN